jgi:hypothetical protein
MQVCSPPAREHHRAGQVLQALGHVGEPMRPRPVTPAKWTDDGRTMEDTHTCAPTIPEYDFDQRVSWSLYGV